MTIKEAIRKVMKLKGSPMTAQEAYEAIISNNLYNFKAAVPSGIVRGEIRRHCIGVDFPSASKTKYFELIGDNTYFYLDSPQKISSRSKKAIKQTPKINTGINEIKKAQKRHFSTFRQKILKEIKKITPENFENFTKNLLEAYGFIDVEVTRKTKDGGIDGFGQLKIGLGLITVAFQCKRYTSKSVNTKEIQAFRGAIQGKCEQGLFFTTSTYTKDCTKLMFQPGAVPIIMINGDGIVEIMIEKEFGVQTEYIPIFINALDLALIEK
ncbi:restriction endonuclease [Desulfospira joergensenii]|uniref:restriction endonuclease n=1 Tax=Desulfospira joergensenii TaxID=53329 RepID=UPI0003B40216|nr:restriction endonuclease [Desulfospira joergensenii]